MAADAYDAQAVTQALVADERLETLGSAKIIEGRDARGIRERAGGLKAAGAGEKRDVVALDDEARVRVAFRRAEMIVVQMRENDPFHVARNDPERGEQRGWIAIFRDAASLRHECGETGVDQRDARAFAQHPKGIDEFDVVVPWRKMKHEAVVALCAPDDRRVDVDTRGL